VGWRGRNSVCACGSGRVLQGSSSGRPTVTTMLEALLKRVACRDGRRRRERTNSVIMHALHCGGSRRRDGEQMARPVGR
jgi:hypothetical protein